MENERLKDIKGKSPFAQEIINSVPSSAVMGGVYYLAGLIGVIILLSVLISYNDVVAGEATLTSDPPLSVIYATRDVQIDSLLVEEGEMVKDGQLIGTFINTADLEDVYRLKSSLKNELIGIGTDSIKIFLPQDLALGPIQESYLDYFLSLQKLSLIKAVNTTGERKKSAEAGISLQEALIKKKRQELGDLSERLKLAGKQLERSTGLYEKGVISKAEMDRERALYLELSGELQNLKSVLDLGEMDLSAKRLEDSQAYYEFLEVQGSEEQISKKRKNELLADIQQWEKNYTMVAPFNGQVSFFDIYSSGEAIGRNQPVCAVSPNNVSTLRGKIKVPVKNSGKVLIGDKVIFKISNYPFEQFGYLIGSVTGISKVPDPQSQTIIIYCIVPTLETNLGYRVNFREHLIGVGEIITEELSLMERAFYRIKRNLSRKG